MSIKKLLVSYDVKTGFGSYFRIGFLNDLLQVPCVVSLG